MKGIRITNILYYEEFSQLSFGFISDNKSNINYDIKVVDESGGVLGPLRTEGSRDFYNKSLEKLHQFMDHKLNKNQHYKVLVMDRAGEIVGEIEFSYK
jgi:hypothetical protein